MQQAQILILIEKSEASEKLCQLLAGNGHDVFLAHSLHEAFQRAKEKRPDVIVVGNMFHKHSGLEVCVELRSEIDTCYAGILLIVPVVDNDTLNRAREAGVNEIIQINADNQHLVDRVELLLNRS